MIRWLMGSGVFLLASSLVGTACSSSPEKHEKEPEFGTLGLPLSTQGASGDTYRLRDATFRIRSDDWHYEDSSSFGGDGSGTTSEVVIVSSEDDPEAATISVSVPAGELEVKLLPGWRLERISEAGAETIEATLLSSSTQWVWVAPRGTSFAEFRFGVGDREIWFNGQLNIGIAVVENPDEYYGTGGGSGWAGSPGVDETGAGGGG